MKPSSKNMHIVICTPRWSEGFWRIIEEGWTHSDLCAKSYLGESHSDHAERWFGSQEI
jgi:hypothetical protein